MSDSTHAFLPAKKIAVACDATLREIENARGEITYDVARELRRHRPLLWFRPISWIVATLPEYLKEITRQHRAGEEMTVVSVRDLARAATGEGETFTVYVSASDFAFIKDHYA